MSTIKESWLHYKEVTLPKDADIDQVMEAKLGFYAGSAAMFWRLMRATQNPSISASEGTAFLDSLNKEIDDFGDAMTAEGLEKFTKEEF